MTQQAEIPPPEQRPLRDLLRELLAVLSDYMAQRASEAVERVLCQPLRRAVGKAVLVGLAFGWAAMAAVLLALAFFNVWLDLFAGDKSLAYAACFLVCLGLSFACAWAVVRERRPRGAASTQGADAKPL